MIIISSVECGSQSGLLTPDTQTDTDQDIGTNYRDKQLPTSLFERSWPYFDRGSYVRINSVPGHVRLIIVLEYHLVSWIVLILCIEF